MAAACQCCNLSTRHCRYMEEHRAVLLGYTDVAVLSKQVRRRGCRLRRPWRARIGAPASSVPWGIVLTDVSRGVSPLPFRLLSSPQASLLSYMPYLSLRCTATLLLLRPNPGTLLGAHPGAN